MKALFSAITLSAAVLSAPAFADPDTDEVLKNQRQEIRQDINEKKESLTHASDYLQKENDKTSTLFDAPVRRKDAVANTSKKHSS